MIRRVALESLPAPFEGSGGVPSRSTRAWETNAGASALAHPGQTALPGLAAAPIAGRERVGDIVGHYRLVEILGEGSMGRVFLARHLTLDRLAAVKILHSEHQRSRELVQRFFREARAVNRINHPNIVAIFDFIEEPEVGRYCFVMEYLAGVPLGELLASVPPPLAQLVSMARQTALALAAAHAVGIVHRDVKPDNILVVSTVDGDPVAKVLDFGVAKLNEPRPDLQVKETAQGTVLGTPAYMPPEQISGQPVDFRIDIYGLGVVLYEMIAGRLPFLAESFSELAAQIQRDPPPRLPHQTLGGERIPPQLAQLVLRCLAKAPLDRPASMAEIAGELGRVLTSGAAQRRHRSVMLGALCVAGAVSLGVATRSPARARPAGELASPRSGPPAPLSQDAKTAEPTPPELVALPSDPTEPPREVPGLLPRHRHHALPMAEPEPPPLAAEPRAARTAGGATPAAEASGAEDALERDSMLNPFAK